MTDASSENTGATVLLVDDNPQNLKVLYETLKDKGYKLLIANDGSKALDLAHRHQPEVILLDIMMPAKGPLVDKVLYGQNHSHQMGQ